MGLHRQGVVKRWLEVGAEADAKRAQRIGNGGQKDTTGAIRQRRFQGTGGVEQQWRSVDQRLAAGRAHSYDLLSRLQLEGRRDGDWGRNVWWRDTSVAIKRIRIQMDQNKEVR